jgi:hypothetical protein
MPSVQDITFVFKLNGVQKVLRFRKIPYSTWKELKARTGFAPLSLIVALGQNDQDAALGLIWLDRTQKERSLRWTDAERDFENQQVDIDVIGFTLDGKVEFGDEADVMAATGEKSEEMDPTTAGT